MSCCRHPVAKLLEIAGYVGYARQLDGIFASADGVFGDEVRKDSVQDIISAELDVSPKTAAELVDQIFEILQSGSPFAEDWSYAKAALAKSVAWRSYDDPHAIVMEEIEKLSKSWNKIREIAFEEAV